MSANARSNGKSFESPDRPPLRAGDSKDRFSFRNNRVDGDEERQREGRNNNTRPTRRENEDDSEGWSKVKPRKSFGAEGVERFNGRMGVQREERKFNKDRETDNRPRTFESFSRDVRDARDNDDTDRDRENKDSRLPRNGIGRGRNEMTWREREAHKERENEPPNTARDRNSNGDKYVERNRGWREKDKDEGDRERRPQRNEYSDRNGGGARWARDQPEEKKPEWMDEPKEERSQAPRTAEEFQKWKEQMHKDKGTGNLLTPADDGSLTANAGASFFGLEKEKTAVETPLAMDSGPDKFFGNWGAKDEGGPDLDSDSRPEGLTKAKSTGKSSRFTSFFNPIEEPQRRVTEPVPPMPPAPPSGLAAFFSQNVQPPPTGNPHMPLHPPSVGPADPNEKEAFQNLLSMFKKTGPSGTTPQPSITLQPKPPAPEKQAPNPLTSPEPYSQYRQERPEDARPGIRQQHSVQDMMVQRQLAGSQASLRQEQMLQEMIAQRQSSNSQSSSRADQAANRNNTDFLMNLIQNTRLNPDQQRGDQQQYMRQQPKITERQMQQQLLEREHIDMARERGLREDAEQRLEIARERDMRDRLEQRAIQQAQQQQQHRRQGPPPGFYEPDPSTFQRPHPQDRQQSAGPPLQPTQILQRPAPPGLDPSWDGRPPHQHQSSQPPPQQQGQQHRMNIPPPPPGLQSGGVGPRNIQPPPQQMFPPGFPVSSFPPEGMPGPGQGLPRGMMGPPPGFYAGPGHQGPPPPGFMPPPPPGMNGGFPPGPEAMFGYDGRGMGMPQQQQQGGFRR